MQLLFQEFNAPISCYKAVCKTLIQYYAAIAFKPFLGIARAISCRDLEFKSPKLENNFEHVIKRFVTKSSPATHHGGAWGERRYSSYSFTTSALDGGEWSGSRPGHALPPGKGPPVPIVQEAGWAPEPVWTQRLEEKSFAPAGDRTPIARSSSP
jgi:hypothetical protein